METLFSCKVILTSSNPVIVTKDSLVISDYYKFRSMKQSKNVFPEHNLYLNEAFYIPCESNVYHAIIYSAIHLSSIPSTGLVLSNSCPIFQVFAKHLNVSVIDKPCVYHVEKLHYFPNGNPRFDKLNRFDKTSFDRFRTSCNGLVSKLNKFPKRLYIKRLSHERKIENESEFENFLLQKTFHIISLELFSFQDQFNYFHNADMIIAVHGAALTHMMFCQSTCKIIELKHNHMNNFLIHNCYAQLAHFCNIHSYHQLYTSFKKFSNRKSKNYNLVVDIKALSIQIDNL